MESCAVSDGKCENRKTLYDKSLVFHQHFVNTFTTKFTFEPANESEAGSPLVTFLTGAFRVVRFWSDTDMILATVSSDGNELSHFILNFGDKKTSAEFTDYMNEFTDLEPRYTFPDGCDK